MYKILFWNQKINPEVLRVDRYCENFLGMMASKSFFSVIFGVAAFAKFVNLSVMFLSWDWIASMVLTTSTIINRSCVCVDVLELGLDGFNVTNYKYNYK